MEAKDKILKPLVEHYHLTTRAQQRWSDAMDLYAKEIAIGFFKWVWFETKWELTKDGWYKDRGDDFDPIYATDDEVYQQYLSYLKTLQP